MPTTFRLAFVTGATPDKWAARWRERHPKDRLELVPVEQADQERVVREGDVDMCLARLPVDTTGLLVVRLYDEAQVVVVDREHVVSAVDEVELADLADEQLVTDPARVPGWDGVTRVERLDWPAMTDRDAVEVAASGAGVAVLPESVARVLHRKDAVHRPVVDLPPTTVALVWLAERDDDATQEMVGITRGRTARSSRG
ncbi:DNA-binding transcriptional LysR family regulator [Nocardioides zeae]|uniref:DNA-binding transcriptional LysR family regulator n=1 Tax=Nocardioides zeae TaxID=1457234 RepID=A0ACC6IHL2_9ACTN|nr:LysR family transcriptional regulator substrate-binding protein [Nocardioides zeae]MDR6176130.1 DNA-binding transcriptional LysR family regulator [Nocardioides zeae]MDR6210276.1 DNA-binding transcriptional LysR family regulator [Nocardioides zeae]